MCGGAIISDFIPTRGSGRLTAGDLWSGLSGEANKQKGSSARFSKPARSEVKACDDFEADFLEFKNESDAEEFQNVKPFPFGGLNPYNFSPAQG